MGFSVCCGAGRRPRRGTHGPAFLSTLRLDEPADLLRSGEDRVGAVAQHPGANQRRPSLLRTVLAGIGLEPKISFPDRLQLAVGCGYPIGVAAIADDLNAILRIEVPEIMIAAAADHAAHRAVLLAGPR